MNEPIENTKDGKRIVITHGELCLVPTNKKPTGELTKTKMYIAAHSETGHHHVLESKTEFEVYEGKQRMVLIKEVATLFHKKTYDIHETRTIVPGTYEIHEKTEYDPFLKVTRRVFD